MVDSKFEQLKQQIEIDLTITKDNVLEKSIQIASLHNKYLTMFVDEYRSYKKALIEKEQLYGELYHKYKFDFEYKLDYKTEIESYINKDKAFITVKNSCCDQECLVKFLEKTVDNIKQMSFNIKNYMDFKKYLEGY